MGVLLNKIADALGIDLGIFRTPNNITEALKPNQEPQAPTLGIEEPQAPTLGIEDKTNENIESQVNGISLPSWQEYMEKAQKEQWEREDQIREETQAREDTAYQRAVADMQKAGINPNLMNVNPASSGGGITSATGLDYTPYTNETQKYLTLLEQEIANAFKEDENGKDRFTDLLSKAIQSIATYYIFKK